MVPKLTCGPADNVVKRNAALRIAWYTSQKVMMRQRTDATYSSIREFYRWTIVTIVSPLVLSLFFILLMLIDEGKIDSEFVVGCTVFMSPFLLQLGLTLLLHIHYYNKSSRRLERKIKMGAVRELKSDEGDVIRRLTACLQSVMNVDGKIIYWVSKVESVPSISHLRNDIDVVLTKKILGESDEGVVAAILAHEMGHVSQDDRSTLDQCEHLMHVTKWSHLLSILFFGAIISIVSAVISAAASEGSAIMTFGGLIVPILTMIMIHVVYTKRMQNLIDSRKMSEELADVASIVFVGIDETVRAIEKFHSKHAGSIYYQVKESRIETAKLKAKLIDQYLADTEAVSQTWSLEEYKVELTNKNMPDISIQEDEEKLFKSMRQESVSIKMPFIIMVAACSCAFFWIYNLGDVKDFASAYIVATWIIAFFVTVILAVRFAEDLISRQTTGKSDISAHKSPIVKWALAFAASIWTCSLIAIPCFNRSVVYNYRKQFFADLGFSYAGDSKNYLWKLHQGCDRSIAEDCLALGHYFKQHGFNNSAVGNRQRATGAKAFFKACSLGNMDACHQLIYFCDDQIDGVHINCEMVQQRLCELHYPGECENIFKRATSIIGAAKRKSDEREMINGLRQYHDLCELDYIPACYHEFAVLSDLVDGEDAKSNAHIPLIKACEAGYAYSCTQLMWWSRNRGLGELSTKNAADRAIKAADACQENSIKTHMNRKCPAESEDLYSDLCRNLGEVYYSVAMMFPSGIEKGKDKSMYIHLNEKSCNAHCFPAACAEVYHYAKMNNVDSIKYSAGEYKSKAVAYYKNDCGDERAENTPKKLYCSAGYVKKSISYLK